MSTLVIPVPDQVRDDGSGVQFLLVSHLWMPAGAGMTERNSPTAGLIDKIWIVIHHSSARR